jgi:cell division protein FtsB
MVSLLIASLAVFYILFDNKGIVRRVQLEWREKELTEEIVRAKEETKRLQAQLKAVENDKKMIETLARERYGMARDGETVYRVKKD